MTNEQLKLGVRHHYKWSRKLDNLLSWLDKPFDSRPQLVLGYIPEVDQIGHAAGPDDPRHRVDRELREVDEFAASLYRELDARNLNQIVDVIFVSDHGMTDTADIRLVYLDLLLGDDYARITHKEGWPSAGLRFEEGVDTDAILQKLEAMAKERPGFDVYTHETMPERWHFVRPVITMARAQ